jgi:hypothetical protein
MSRIDQNRVNLGPAKIKTDDSIYDAVDQGIVGVSTTTVVAPPPDPGYVPIGPIGDLITPPVLAPVSGYPIYATDVLFNDGNGPYPYFATNTSWAFMNLSSVGSFTNALVVNGGGSSLDFINLDNPSQRTTLPSRQKFGGDLDFIVRDGVLTHGWSYLSGVFWVEDNLTITVGGVTRTIAGATLNFYMAGGVSDYTHRYFYLSNFGGAVGHVYARVPHTGPLSLEVVGSVTSNPGVTPEYSVLCIESGVLWLSSSFNASNITDFYAIDIATGVSARIFSSVALLDIISPSTDGSWFGLLNGSMAYLGARKTVGSNFVYPLRIIGLDGSVTTQESFITLPTSGGSLSQFVAIPGTETMLATHESGSVVYQISTAGYQTISGFPPEIRLLRLSSPNPGTLRFWGSSATTTQVALYEVAL